MEREIKTKKSIISIIEKDALQKIFNESSSYCEILRKLGVSDKCGGTYRTLQLRIKKDDINLENLNKNRAETCSIINRAKRMSLKDILIENSTYCTTSRIKKMIIEEKLLIDMCCKCGQLPAHNGKPLTLQLDHINGNRYDHRIENLRILCPNCHTQTETYGSKNARTKTFFPLHKKTRTLYNSPIKMGKCIKCDTQIGTYTKTSMCRLCYLRVLNGKMDRVNRRPDKKILTDDICSLPLLQIGNKYGVSDNAVRKWLKYYNLPSKRKDIKELKNNMAAVAQSEEHRFVESKVVGS